MRVVNRLLKHTRVAFYVFFGVNYIHVLVVRSKFLNNTTS